ncbi:PilN domain-containing protein [Syntrophomonas wolfei]|nr:PilN domain-containing protein [Syntrophomonas wolfei]
MRHRSWISINLLNQEGVKAQKATYFLGLMLLLLLSGGMYYYYQSAHEEMLLQQKLNINLEARAKELLPIARAGRMEEKNEENAWRKRKFLEETRLQQISYVAVFKEIERSLSPGILLLGIEMEKGRIAIQGYAADNQELSFLMAGIREKSSFGNPVLLSSSLDENKEEIEFRVEINWGEEAD